LTPELLFEVGLGLDRKDAGVHLLVKEVLRPPHSPSIFEKGKGGVDSVFQNILAFGQLLEMVL